MKEEPRPAHACYPSSAWRGSSVAHDLRAATFQAVKPFLFLSRPVIFCNPQVSCRDL